MNKKNVFHILCCCALIGISFSILVLPKLYDVVVSTGKNKYTVTAPTLNPESENTLGLMLTIAVNQPKKERIIIMSEDADGRNWLGGDQIESFLNATHPELASNPKLVDGGVQLDIKASDKQVVIKIPVTMLETATTSFKIKRGKHTVEKLKATYVRKDKPDVTEEDSSADEKPKVTPTSQVIPTNKMRRKRQLMVSDMNPRSITLNTTNISKETATQTKMIPLNTPSSSEESGKTRQVANYDELVGAVKDENVNRIEFTKEIIASDTQSLPVINRSLVIDGKGNKFATTGYQTRDMIQLKNSGADRLRFTVTNMKVERFGTEEQFYFIKVLNSKNNWEINLEDVETTGNNKDNGGLVYNHSGATFLRGKILWYSPDSLRGTENEGEFLKFAGVINSQHIKIAKSEDGSEPDIKIHTNGPALRAYRYGREELSSIKIEAGKVELHSRNAQAIYINAEDSLSAAVFEVKGKNTEVQARGSQATSASKKDHGDYAGSGVIAIVGDNESEQAKGRSYTKISDGAKLYVKALESNSGKADSAILHQVKSGKFIITGKGTKLTCEAETPQSGITAVLRFRLHGSQRISVKAGAILEVTRNRGKSSALRFYDDDNTFNISGGGKVQIYNKGEGDDKASDGGPSDGRQGIEYANTSAAYQKRSGIYLDDENSSLYVKSEYGPALESGLSPFDIKANPQTAISLVGKSRSRDSGALKFINTASIKIVLDNPYFYEFANTRDPEGGKGGGSWISGVGSYGDIYGKTEFHAKNIPLLAWRRGWDLTGIADQNYDRMNFQLEGNEFGTVTSASQSASDFAAYVRNKQGICQQFSKISGMALAAKLENLRQPTNADKRIYGQISVPRRYGKNGPTDYQLALTNEVRVTLRLYRLKFKKGVTAPKGDPSKNEKDFDATYEVKTYDKEVNTISDGGVSQFGEEKTCGVFEWNLEKDDRFKGEDEFLWAGDFVEVINIRTSWNLNPGPFDIVTQNNKFRNKGRYVFNVMPVEVTPDVTQGHIDPVLDATTAQTTMSDATKSLRMQSSARSIRKHAAVVPLDKTFEGGTGKEGIITGSNGKNQVSFYPMLSVADKTRTNPDPETISQYQQDSQQSQLDLYSYLSPDEVDGKTAELFAFSDWDADISSLGEDLPPTYQKLTDITTTDDDNAFYDGGNGTTLYGLKMPNKTEPVTYHDVTFQPAPQLKIESFAPTSLETSLSKEGDGKLDTVDLNGENVVTYQVKLTNPEIGKFPNQLLLGYAMTFEVSGNAEIFDGYSGIKLVDGVSAEVSEDKKKVTLTATDQAKLGAAIGIPVAVSGEFKIKVTAWGRTLQEKTYGLPRGSWDVSEEGHNFDKKFTPGSAVPDRKLSDYVTYYRKLKAKEVTQKVTTTQRTPSSKVYLSIADGKLTIYYRQLKDKTKVKVTVDGKELTEFKVDYSDVEQAKPLNLKLDGVRNIVKVSYTDADNNTKTVTWKNPKIKN